MVFIWKPLFSIFQKKTMRNNVLFIDETTIKNLSVVGDNLDAKYIAPSIVAVQDVYLEPLIGTKLLQKIADVISNDTMSDNPQIKTLLDEYIQPYLLNKTVSEICVQIFAKIRNAGVAQFTDTNQNNVNLENVNYLRKHYDDLALVYGNRMIDYLNKNRSLYPDYKCTTDGGNVNPQGEQGQNYCNIHF